MGRDKESLKQTYSSLAYFSDLDWDAVSQEFLSLPPLLTFPEYLQEKAESGDCPVYLFELAYYLYAVEKVAETQPEFHSGINSSAIFMNLEFDVSTMLANAEDNRPEILERTHVLCLFKNPNDEVIELELSQAELEFLAKVETSTHPKEHPYDYLSEAGLLLL